jgi:RNA polymerase sigma-70 factor (ECF subfamily)
MADPAGNPRHAPTDEGLMMRVRDHDCPQAIGQLVDRWQAKVQRLCYRLCGRWEDAEDLTQETFSRLVETRARYRPTAKFSTYLWTIALNRCRDWARQQRRRKRLVDQGQYLLSRFGDDLAGEGSELYDGVQAALQQLKPAHREIVVLRHYEELKFHEIAELLQIPRGTVASRMATALKLLAEYLKPDQGRRDPAPDHAPALPPAAVNDRP